MSFKTIKVLRILNISQIQLFDLIKFSSSSFINRSSGNIKSCSFNLRTLHVIVILKFHFHHLSHLLLRSQQSFLINRNKICFSSQRTFMILSSPFIKLHRFLLNTRFFFRSDRSWIKQHFLVIVQLCLSSISIWMCDQSIRSWSRSFWWINQSVELLLLITHYFKHFHLQLFLLLFPLKFILQPLYLFICLLLFFKLHLSFF